MKRTNLYLDEGQAVALDEVAGAAGISRSELVRRLVGRGLGAEPVDLEVDLAAIESSFGVLGGDSPAARETDARAAHLDRMRRR